MKNHNSASMAAAIQRMNGTAIAIRENDTSLITNIQQMMSSEDDFMEPEAEARMQENLCAAYGFGKPTGSKPFAFANGTAIIPIHGTLINRYGGYYYGYVTGYNFIRAQRNAALADPDVTSIIYDVNSNGGEAAGCFELAQEMYDTRGEKPSLAVVDSNCYSAAYALASAVDKIAVTPSGGAGSIGVISMHIDMSAMLERVGIKINIIKSGEHKADGNPYEVMSDETKARWQASVDTMRTEFVNLVAQNRNLDPKVVRDTEALCYNAGDALKLGLVDSIASPASAVAEFIQGESSPSMAASTEPTGATAMSFTQEEMDAARAESASAERTRISGIMGCEAAEKRPTLAKHIAFNTSMSVDDAGTMLAASAEEVKPEAAKPVETPKADTSPFKETMDAANHPNAAADTTDNSNNAESDGLMEALAFVTGDDTTA